MKRAILWFIPLTAIAICALFLQSRYDEWFVYPSLRMHLSDHLKDPESTQYRNEFMIKAGWLCGELNSKNGNGVYVGFRRYISGSSDDAHLEGHGYVGDGGDAMRSSALMLEELDREIAVNQAIIEKTYPGLSRAEIEDIVSAEYFEKKWQAMCINS